MSPVLGDFDFVNFEGFLVPSPCADNVRFKIVATSVGPTAVLIVPETPGLSEASEECVCSKPLISLRSFGRSTNITSSSLAFLIRLRASRAISGPVSLPLSARILLGSDVMTRVAFAMALRVAPCTKICGGSSDNDVGFEWIFDVEKLSRMVVTSGAAGRGVNGSRGECIPDVEGTRAWPDKMEAASELAVESSVTIGRDFTVDEAEGVGLRIDMPRFPKTLLAVRRLLLGRLDPTRPLGIVSEDDECLSLSVSGLSRDFPLVHQVPIQSPNDGRSCCCLIGTMVVSLVPNSSAEAGGGTLDGRLELVGLVKFGDFSSDGDGSSAIGDKLLRSDMLLGRTTSSAKASAKDSASDYTELFNTHVTYFQAHETHQYTLLLLDLPLTLVLTEQRVNNAFRDLLI